MPREIGGIPLGDSKDPRLPTQELLAKYGIYAHPYTISCWRSGIKSGGRLEDKINCAKKLELDDALDKDYTYLSIARSGIRLRKNQQSPWRAHLLASEHFTKDIARDIQLDPQLVRKAIRAMRTELVMDHATLNPDQKAFFVKTAEDYLKGRLRLAPSLIPKFLLKFNDKWNRTIPGFYSAFYQFPTRMIGTWTPYEVEFISSYYQMRIAAGSTLSTLDRKILETFVSEMDYREFVKEIKQETQIDIDQSVLSEHKNFLIYGKPFNPHWVRPKGE